MSNYTVFLLKKYLPEFRFRNAHMNKQFVLNLLVLFIALASGPAAKSSTYESVTLQLKWEHQFQFAGFYAAIAQGYYEEEGLAVELKAGSPGLDPITEVLDGRADFGISSSDLLLRFHQGDPVVAMAVIFQHSPLILVAKTDKATQTLHDLDGKRVAIEEGSAELYAYLKREGIQTAQFNVVKHDYNLDGLIDGTLAAQSVYSTTETYELDQQGINYQVYSPRSAGIDFYGDTLFTTREMLTRHIKKAEAFRRASLRGWLYAMNHSDEIIELILTHYSTSRSRAALKNEADVMQHLMRTDLIEPGHMITGRWKHMAEVYAEIGMLPNNLSLDGFLYYPQKKEVALQQIYKWLILASLISTILAIGISFTLHYNQRLRKSEQKARSLFDNAPLAFMVIDSSGNIKDWNRAATEIFGWSKEEIINRNVFDTIINIEGYSSVKAILDRTFNERNNLTFVNKNNTKSGQEIICEWINTPYFYNDKENESQILSIGSNITERVAIHKSLKKAKNEAQEALDEHKQLLAMLSHEIRSPLAAIASANAVLKATISQGNLKETYSMNKRINSAIQRLRQFLDNLMTDDRLTISNFTNSREQIDLKAVLHKSVHALQDFYPTRNINVSCSLPNHIMGPAPMLLDIVIKNLLENALKYSPENTDVSVSAVSDADHGMLIEVHNFGLPIPEDLHKAIFRKYYRTDHAEHIVGTGVGLFLVKRIVDNNQGSINIESTTHEGTRFRVTFP